MKHLLKIILTIGACFAATFIIIKGFNILTISDIEGWLMTAKTASPLWVGLIIAGLLFADLFIAVPTLTLSILAGYFLGAQHGSIAAFSGMLLAGIVGYGLSRRYGAYILTRIMKNPQNRAEATRTFKRHGFAMIILSRAVPILPEVTACLAGLSGMRFGRFFVAWCISSAPYVTIAAYAGSVSSAADPTPALYTALLMTATLWTGWYGLNRHMKKART